MSTDAQSSRVLVIAEAGVNHNGDLGLARQLIDRAAEAGADLIKFQTFVTEKCIAAEAPKANYQISNAIDPQETQFEMVKKLELSPAAHDDLIAHCAERRIGFFSTGFDEESVNLLVRLGAERLKVPSGEITNLPLLRHIGRQRKPVILSTGMATMEEIAAALQVLETAGTPPSSVTVLHCTTEYPAPFAEVNLRAMLTIAQRFGVVVGYSDHTVGIEVPIAAVALGARVIEKHFTLNRQLPGPDHKASLEPTELKAMIRAIRNIEVALGDGVKRVGTEEAKNRIVARKSIVASRAITAGEPYTAENIAAKRPGTGISPMRWDELIGRLAPRDFCRDEPIHF